MSGKNRKNHVSQNQSHRNIQQIPDDEIEEIIEHEEILEEENEELVTEVKQFKKRFVFLIIFFLLSAAFLGSAIGYYYFQTANTKKNLTESEQKIQTADDKLKNEAKIRAEKELSLTQATAENQDLKNAAAKKAEDDAKKELKQKEEADKAAKKYVIANKKESTQPGLNSRKTPCGELAGGLRVWGTAGEVLEGPTKPGPCLNGDYEWYRVKWNDGVEGWSIVNYLDFTGEKQFSQTGYITGYAPIGWDWETNKNVNLSKICATNQVDKIEYCNAQVDVSQGNYKLVVPAGEYVMSGTYKYKEFDTQNFKEFPMYYPLINQCGFTNECYQKYPNGYNESGKVRVETGGVAINVNMTVKY